MKTRASAWERGPESGERESPRGESRAVGGLGAGCGKGASGVISGHISRDRSISGGLALLCSAGWSALLRRATHAGKPPRTR